MAKKYDKTAEGKYLKKLSKEGAISPEERARILAEQNRTLGGQAEVARAQAKGDLINRGFEGSIAGARQLAAPNIARMQQLGETSRDISAQNEQSKREALRQYALRKTQYSENQAAQNRQALGELALGLGQAGAGYYAGKRAEGKEVAALARTDASNERLRNLSNLQLQIQMALSSGDTEKAKQLLSEYLASQGQ